MRARQDEGFSIVELVVVIIILGILAAIAISVFLGQREKAAAASAKQTLRNVNLIAESFREDGATYPDAPGEYRKENRSYTYLEEFEAAKDPSQVSVRALDGGSKAVFATRGLATCYYVRLDLGGEIVRHLAPVDETTGPTCRASEFETGAGSGWE